MVHKQYYFLTLIIMHSPSENTFQAQSRTKTKLQVHKKVFLLISSRTRLNPSFEFMTGSCGMNSKYLTRSRATLNGLLISKY
jgi:hypothetical protein